MPRLPNSRQDWVNAYRGYEIVHSTAMIVCIVSALVGVGVFTFLDGYFSHSTVLVTLIVFAIISVFGFYFMAVFGAAVSPMKNWKRRIAKDPDNIKSVTSQIEYQIEMMGLEPVNKIELKRKEQSPKS